VFGLHMVTDIVLHMCWLLVVCILSVPFGVSIGHVESGVQDHKTVEKIGQRVWKALH
jgi:putative exporter of polyketide antibiotics